ncbi:TPA: hypothetical protein NHH84_003050 [Legionella pneumophila]|nr:hypothetical protein [Legionella pneumophila]
MTESEATPQRFERLFDAEYTHLTLRPATGVEPKDVHLDIELTLGGDVSEAEVDQLIADLNPDYWWSDRTGKNTQWGGQSSVTTVVVQFAAGACPAFLDT